MKQILLIYFLALIQVATAQTQNYFSPSFQTRVNSKTPHKRLYEKLPSGIYHVKDFKDKSLTMEGYFEGFTDLENLDAFIWYFRNGKLDNSNIKPEGQTGRVTYYCENGNKSDERIYKNHEIYYAQVWNNQNEPILISGNGQVIDYNPTLKEKTYKIYKDSTLTGNYAIRDINSDTIYYSADINAEPPNGMNAYAKDIVNILKYPGVARLLGAEGRIHVAFIVNEDGSLSDFEPLGSRRISFENRTIDALRKLKKWTPAVLNKRNVKQRFVLPVLFQLK